MEPIDADVVVPAPTARATSDVAAQLGQTQQATEAQARYIIQSKFRFVYRIYYADGFVLNQLDAAGVEQKIDFLRPARRIEWVSVVPGQRSFHLDVPPETVFRIWRNVIKKMGAPDIIGGYILGYDRFRDGQLTEQSWYYCSPLRQLLLKDLVGTSESKTRLFQFEQQFEGPQPEGFKYAFNRWWENNSHLVIAAE